MNDGENGTVSLEEAEKVVVQGKTLLEWARTDSARLESIYEHTFDPRERAMVLTVYKFHCLNKKS